MLRRKESAVGAWSKHGHVSSRAASAVVIVTIEEKVVRNHVVDRGR
jgi:hypothetical protein